MGPTGGLFTIGRTNSGILHHLDVVAQLRPQAGGLNMIVVLTVVRLMALAGVKRLGFTERRVTPPDPVTLPTATTAAWRLRAKSGHKQNRNQQRTKTRHEAIEPASC